MTSGLGAAALALAIVASPTRGPEGDPWSPITGRLAVTQGLGALCRAAQGADDCAKTIERSQAGSGRFKRTGDLLVVKVPNGRDVELRDSPADKVGTIADDAVARFAYIEHLASAGQHLVHVWGYEGTEFILIDAKTGRKTRLFGLPVPSPSGGRVACSPVHLAVDMQRVEVWRRAGDGFVQEWAKDLDWAPAPPSWSGEDAIRVRALAPGATTTANFLRVGGAWSEAPAK
jgi:hypothetical protein